MDKLAIRAFAILVHEALDIREQHYNSGPGGKGISDRAAARLAGAPPELIRPISLLLHWPADAREWADRVAPRGNARSDPAWQGALDETARESR